MFGSVPSATRGNGGRRHAIIFLIVVVALTIAADLWEEQLVSAKPLLSAARSCLNVPLIKLVRCLASAHPSSVSRSRPGA